MPGNNETRFPILKYRANDRAFFAEITFIFLVCLFETSIVIISSREVIRLQFSCFSQYVNDKHLSLGVN